MITIPATAIATATGTARLSRRLPAAGPNYARRRAVAAAVAVLLVLAVVQLAVVLLAGFGGDPASASGAVPAPPAGSSAPAVHVARAGDTLWSIATAHRGAVSHDAYVDALIRLNGGTSIQVGQAVRLP